MSEIESLYFTVLVTEKRPAPVRVRLARGLPAETLPRLYRLDPDGKPVMFDPERVNTDSFLVPCRFEPEDPSCGFSDGNTPGSLIFVSEGESEKRYYQLEFHPCEAGTAKLHDLIGDGDTFRLPVGETLIDGFASPVYYGNRLFGKPGLIIAGVNGQGCFFFAGELGAASTMRCCGALRDKSGALIEGNLLFIDLNGDDILDILACREDGTVWRYDNTGTDCSPVFVLHGKLFDLMPHLHNLTFSVRMPDGSVNPVYPEMEVIYEHGKINDVRGQLTHFSAQGKNGVLVSVKGGFLLFFLADKKGNFKFSGFALDEDGNPLTLDDACAPITPCDGTPESSLFFGVTFHGRWFMLEFKSFSAGQPIFAMHFHDEVLTSLTSVNPLLCGEYLLLGGHGGSIERFRVSRSAMGIQSVTPDGKLLRQNAYPGFQALGTAVYTDISGNGRYGLLSGNVRGRVSWYNNHGTRRNPELHGSGILRDQHGIELKMEHGPDPLEPCDGYAKPIALRMHRDSRRSDILSGSGSGEVFHWRNLGEKSDGTPVLEFAGVLRDTSGAPIRCHHMSALTAAHWLGADAPDLIVAGQCSVHAAPDNDPDPSQVRVYPGTYTKEGNLVFAPYQVIHQCADKQFAYRPIPPELTNRGVEVNFRLGWMTFRRIGTSASNEVEFVEEWPFPPTASSWLPAYAVRSELYPGDEVFLINSCVGSLKVFREAFQRLGGYAACMVCFCSAGHFQVDTLPATKPPPNFTSPLPETKERCIETPKTTVTRREDGRLDLMIHTADTSPQNMLVNCVSDRGPVYDDDRLEIRIYTPTAEPILLMVNPLACICIYRLAANGLLTAPDNAAELYREINAKTDVTHDGWQLSLRLPGKLVPSESRLAVQRCQAHYAGKIRALEQRKTAISKSAILTLS